MRYLKGAFGVLYGDFWGILEGPLEYIEGTFCSTLSVHLGYFQDIF